MGLEGNEGRLIISQSSVVKFSKNYYNSIEKEI